METAWEVLINATSPSDISAPKHNNINNNYKQALEKLVKMREEINAEVSRCSRIPPRFSEDGTFQ